MRKPGISRWYPNAAALVGKSPAKAADIEKLCSEVETMDIESRGLIGETLAGAASSGDSVVLFQDLDDLLFYALDHPLMIAHNGGGFDFPRLIQRFFVLGLQDQYTIDTFFSGTRMIAVSYTRKGERKACSLWLDSYAQVPTSLAKFTKAFAPHLAKLKGAVNFEAGEVWEWTNPLHQEYLRRDVLGLKAAYIAFVREMHKEFGIRCRMSAAGNALQAFKVNILEREVADGHLYSYFKLNEYSDALSRRACFGGWVFPGTHSRVYEHTVKKDFRGAYGCIMRDTWFPLGTPYYVQRYVDGRCGIYDVTVTAPTDQWCASVPIRTPEGQLRYLPAGETATTSMIAEAVSFYREHGYTVEVVQGIVWPRKEQIFRPLMLKCERMELQGGARKDIAKLVRNGLSGRFNLGHESKRLIATDTPPDGAIPILAKGSIVPYVYEVTEAVEDSCQLPHLYAYVTGLHRLKMVGLALMLGPDNFLYCDTDSIEAPIACDGMECFYQGDPKLARYGDCITEAYHKLFIAWGPKHYYCESEDGERDVRLKGIPRRKMNDRYIHSRLLESKKPRTFSFESPTNARTMLQSAGTADLGSVRTRKVAYNTSGTWQISESGEFTPCRLVLVT